MAVRFDADGESYTRSTGLTTVTNFSFSCWVRLAVDQATTTVILQIDNGSGTGRMRLNAWNGTALTFQSDSGGWFGTIGHTLVVGTWTFVGLSVTANPGQARTAVRTAGSTTFAGGSPTQTNITINANTLRIGDGQAASEWLNGSVAAVKVWDQALTADELQQESWTYQPKRTNGLRGWYPLITPSTTDFSGSSQTLSGGSGAATDDPPPITWSAGRRRIFIPSAVQAVTGALDANLPALTGSAEGAVTVAGALGPALLPALSGQFDADATVAGQLDGTLPALTGTLTGDTGTPGILNGTLPAITGAFTGQVIGGFLVADLPALTGAFDGHLRIGGQLDGALPALTSALAGDVEIPPHDISPTSNGPQRGWAARTPTNWATTGNATRGWAAGQPTT